MEELALEIRSEIDHICAGYYYYKNEDVLSKSRSMADDIRDFCSFFLQGNLFGMTTKDYENLQQYVLQVLQDYIEATKQKDIVFMLDTLDYGLRELLNICIDEDTEETKHE